MADEIAIGINFAVNKGSLKFTYNNSARATLTNDPAVGGVQNISTTTESISMVDVSTAGWSVWNNLTNGSKAQLGAMSGATFVPLVQLNYNEPCALRLATTSPHMRVTVPTNGTAAIQFQIFSE